MWKLISQKLKIGRTLLYIHTYSDFEKEKLRVITKVSKQKIPTIWRQTLKSVTFWPAMKILHRSNTFLYKTLTRRQILDFRRKKTFSVNHNLSPQLKCLLCKVLLVLSTMLFFPTDLLKSTIFWKVEIHSYCPFANSDLSINPSVCWKLLNTISISITKS